MKKEELVKLASTGKAEVLIDQLFCGTPHAFEARPAEYDKFKAQLSHSLNVAATHIIVVGSGRFGFSLAPHKFGRPFNDRSDLDVIIVDESLFDLAWLELIRYDFKSLSFDRDITESLKEHRSNNIFWGYLEPYKLKNALSFYKKVWFPAFAALGFFRPAAGRTVKARLYRTWEHARNYHRFGLRLLVQTLAGETNEI
jgi:hypothetical protein